MPLPDYEQLPDGRYVVTNTCGLDFGWFRVPCGFVSDGDTMPDLVRRLYDSDELRSVRLRYAIGHDYLYRTRLVSRRVADGWLRDSEVANGFSRERAFLEWIFVRACGWYYWHFVP